MIDATEAADLLNVRHEYLIGLIQKGDLSATTNDAGRYQLDRDEVLAWKTNIDAERGKVLDELTALSQEMGLYN